MTDATSLGPLLPHDVLERRRSLPTRPAPVELSDDRVLLRPYDATDGEELQAISNGEPVTRLARSIDCYDAEELIWRFMPAGPFPEAAALVAYQDAVAALAGSRIFSVADRTTGELLGSASYLASEPVHLKVEIGNVWYTPVAQGSGVNAAATGLLVAHAFDLGYFRVEWKCNAGNLRSRAAAERLGFTFEGVQEAHMIQKRRHRDTAWYRMLASDTGPG